MTKTSKSTNKSIDDEKEDFCGACVIMPLALASAGTTVYASGKGGTRKKRKIIMISGIVATAISLLVMWYYLRTCSECK